MAVDTFDLPALRGAVSNLRSVVGRSRIYPMDSERGRERPRQGIWEPMTREGVGFPKACSGRINKRAHIRF